MENKELKRKIDKEYHRIHKDLCMLILTLTSKYPIKIKYTFPIYPLIDKNWISNLKGQLKL